MEGQSAIWVIASKCNTGERIEEMLREARLINPVKRMQSAEQVRALLYPGCPAPAVVFLDLAVEEEFFVVAIHCLRELGCHSRVIAVVNQHNEAELDRAYEAGVKTYVQENFSFADFLDRARVLGLRFAIGRNDSPSG